MRTDSWLVTTFVNVSEYSATFGVATFILADDQQTYHQGEAVFRKNPIQFNKLCSLHTGKVRKSLMNPIDIYHLLMVHISWQRFSIVQNQWGKIWLWHKPKDEEKLLQEYCQSKAKQEGRKYIQQLYADLHITLLPLTKY